MKFLAYLEERFSFILANLSAFMIALIFMLAFKIKWEFLLLIFGLWFIPLIAYIIYEFIKRKKYYSTLEDLLENLEYSYLLPEVMSEPKFIEEKILYEILRQTSKGMHEQVNYYKAIQEEYREYIEHWIHEIKTPIAATNLIIENNEDPITDKIGDELRKIEGFVEQTLYYSRSNDVSKDYIIKSFSLNKSIISVIKSNSRDFIQKRLTVDLQNIDYIVYSDSKWVEFIINQLINNAIKYSKPTQGFIKIHGMSYENKIILSIEDNGIGMNEKDIQRVFEKGFTGENGRKFGKSTGIGLYLCKKLSNKLNIGLTIESKLDKGTKVNLIFPIGTMTTFK